MENEKKRQSLIGVAVVTAFLVIFGLVIFFASYQIVPPSHVGLVIKGGELQDNVETNGFYMKMPFWTDIEPVFIGTISTDEDSKGKFKEDDNPFRGIQPLSKDGQVLDIDAQINYAISQAKMFRERTGSNDPRTIEQLAFVPALRAIVYDYASEYSWKGLIQEGDRQEFSQRVFRTITTGEVTKRTCKEESKKVDEKTGTEVIIEAGCEVQVIDAAEPMSSYGVTISAVNFKKIKPNQKIINAVEEAQAKEQEVKIAQQEAIIEKANADKAFNIQDGVSRSEERKAQAEAYKLRVLKEEEAEGVKALAAAEKERAAALAASQQLVEYKKLDIQLVLAEAQLEAAKHYKGDVPDTVSIFGTDELAGASLYVGMPSIVANPSGN